VFSALSTTIVDAMTPAQCRAARALLDISQSKLAQLADLGLSTIVDFEKKRRQISLDAAFRIRAALERAGVEFIDENDGGSGLRFRTRTQQRGRK
jgi:transcriptional regulator with XRE-family HTH domain